MEEMVVQITASKLAISELNSLSVKAALTRCIVESCLGKKKQFHRSCQKSYIIYATSERTHQSRVDYCLNIWTLVHHTSQDVVIC